jgi:hypothetical protein
MPECPRLDFWSLLSSFAFVLWASICGPSELLLHCMLQEWLQSREAGWQNLSIYLSVCLSVYLSIHPYIYYRIYTSSIHYLSILVYIYDHITDVYITYTLYIYIYIFFRIWLFLQRLVDSAEDMNPDDVWIIMTFTGPSSGQQTQDCQGHPEILNPKHTKARSRNV